MGKQRNRLQMKEQENFPKEIDEMKVSNLPDSELRVKITRMFDSIK